VCWRTSCHSRRVEDVAGTTKDIPSYLYAARIKTVDPLSPGNRPASDVVSRFYKDRRREEGNRGRRVTQPSQQGLLPSDEVGISAWVPYSLAAVKVRCASKPRFSSTQQPVDQLRSSPTPSFHST
jgi:hypothetical protein